MTTLPTNKPQPLKSGSPEALIENATQIGGYINALEDKLNALDLWRLKTIEQTKQSTVYEIKIPYK